MSKINSLHIKAYERDLKIRNRSPRTAQNYRETLLQLAAFVEGADLLELARGEVEGYILHVLESRSAASASGRYRALRAFYNWAVREELIPESPMRKMTPPKVVEKPIPVVPDQALKMLLAECAGTDFESRRDTAIIRLWCEPGSPRVSEVAGMSVGDVDQVLDLVKLLGKGGRVRVIPFGTKTGQALYRYLRARKDHPLAKGGSEALWLGARGKPLTASGLYQMLERRARQAGVGHIHPHQLRHTSAHNWRVAGGSESDAMVLFGWVSPEMPRRYGRSAEVERAQTAARRISVADRL
ncbi:MULTISPECIES: tyrosine-type recombinase/integrase [unclassified Micromonospora]|uniref:tyrosine-type recombinase/integrase n=1 Tax=unclassified Micromonospora TaxID=2617518 RepID=UPI00098CF414|nr:MULTISPECIES: tyrosine-type recombinase/integrase [unclassified Micromonospora]MDI5937024.1 tyrosine-type recombinase/integrase [Micromonospora sp. DH15]OON33403.1 integrase [Micromonospora sp. Rc5]